LLYKRNVEKVWIKIINHSAAADHKSEIADLNGAALTEGKSEI
jgi:hypothetical protein